MWLYLQIQLPSKDCFMNIGRASGSGTSAYTPRERAIDLEEVQSQNSKSNIISTSSNKGSSKGRNDLNVGHENARPITTGKHFMQYLNKVEDHLEHCSDSETRDYVNRLENDLKEINLLLDKVSKKVKYLVSNKRGRLSLSWDCAFA